MAQGALSLADAATMLVDGPAHKLCNARTIERRLYDVRPAPASAHAHPMAAMTQHGLHVILWLACIGNITIERT